MNWLDLGEPKLLTHIARYDPVVWPSSTVVDLPELAGRQTKTLSEIVSYRRTRRTFAPLEAAELGALMALTCRVQRLGERSLGFPLSRRPVPSAGAIHPVHLVMTSPSLKGWQRYDPIAHALSHVPSKMDPADVRQAIGDLVSAPEATILLLIAEPGMTAAKYAAPASLIWRDAGALLGFLVMAAESLGLSFCPLGISGEPFASRLLDQPGLVGVGAALVGAIPI